VWNVYGKHGRQRPSAERAVVPNAHPAIITLGEAERILSVNQEQARVAPDRSSDRTQSVPGHNGRYLLTGGVLVSG